jgi:putative ABC transport system permease protein
MYIFKNALTSIVRNKGRNLLIGIIILVISCATAVTLAINNSSSSLIESYKSKYETEATLGVNRENMMGNFDKDNKDESMENMQDAFSEANSISIEDIEKYGDSDYVKDYYYTMTVGVNSSSLEAASTDMSFGDDDNNDSENRGGDMPNGGGQGGGKMGFSNSTSGDFTLTGYSKISAMSDFISGTYKISEGEVSTDFDSNNCIINSELATLNNISVGDTITITDPLDDSITYDLTVTGIFEESSDDNQMSMFSNSVNTIITNTNFVTKVKEGNSELSVETSPTFTLTSSDVVEDFEAELKEKGLSDNLSVQTNLDQVENSTSTISNVKTFAVTFLIITLIIGTVVLLVINMINIRERKYEIGVLRTIGMKKSKVALQFLYELLIVALVFLLVGAGIGACISVPISNHLLESEISSSTEETQNIQNNFGHGGDAPGSFGDNQSGDNQSNDNSSNTKSKGDKMNKTFSGVANVQAFTSIDAVVDFKVLLELLAIGLVITLISCSSAIISIQRFSPLTILKERS